MTVFSGDALAQRVQRRSIDKNTFGTRIVEKKVTEPDSIELARRDSIFHADSIRKADSVALLSYSSISMPAFSSARDSIMEDFADGKRLIYYYGDVSVEYQDMTLKAAYMEYDMNTGTVFASGVLDTLTGEWTGLPVMTQAGKTYNIETVRYNFNTRKARIYNMITNEEDATLHGKNIKMLEDHSINISKGKYTVCELEHPHYYLEMMAAKVIPGENRKTVFGPAHLVVGDVHIPFVGLPFGFVPKRPKRATGILMPTFGEETARGFYARDAGMYFVLGDNMDISVTGDYYTLGSWGLDINSRYKVLYKFNGSFGMNYSMDQTGEKGSPDFMQSTNFGLKWSHSQDPKAHPGTTFSASVNFSSPSNNRFNSHSVNEALQNQISSSVSYSKSFGNKVNMSVSGLHSQNSRDSSYSFTLPNVSLSVSTFYPFKQKHRVGKEKIYEKISFGYSTSFQNRVNFKMSQFKDDQGAFSFDTLTTRLPKMFTNGVNHNFNIGLPSFQLAKYINVSPSIKYGQTWAFSQGSKYLENVTDADGNPVMVTDADGNPVNAQRVVTDKGEAFNTFGLTHNYSGSISFNTRLYGMFNFGKYSKVQAIRHVISPSVSMSFSPDKGKAFNGWYMLDPYYDESGRLHDTENELYYNVYALSSNNSVSAPGRGKSAKASFSIANNFEAKVRDMADTTGKGSKKVKLIDQLNFNSGYNFLADSLKFSNINMSFSTSFFNKIRLDGSATLEPYAILADGNRTVVVNKSALSMNQGLARMSSFRLSASYSISGKGVIDGNDGTRDSQGKAIQGAADAYKLIYFNPITQEYIPTGYLYYTNPDVPWSLSFSASYNSSRRYSVVDDTLRYEDKKTATLNMNGSLKLTPRMNITGQSGYDFNAKKVSTTQFSAVYDLHCFKISVSWVPLGTWKSYSFLIAANAAALSDILRFKKSSSYWDN